MSAPAPAAEEKKDKEEEEKVRTEGEIFRTDFTTTLGELCPPITNALSIFGNDKLLWMIIISAMHIGYYFMCPPSLLFLLPYPIVYFFPMYSSLVALQSPLEPRLRSLWLSYWVIMVLVDLSEMILLGTLVQTLQYWPAFKIVFAIWLICQTPDFDSPGKIDEKAKKKMEEEFRIKRKVMEVDGSSQAKIDKYKTERRSEMKFEIEKTRVRDKRYHAYMLVEPFLPEKTHAGGEAINFSEKKKRRSSAWPGKEEEWKEFNKERLDYYIEQGLDKSRSVSKRLGDWARPVVEIDGQVVDHNPIVDDQGNMYAEHVHGNAGDVRYTNTWNHDEKMEGTGATNFAEMPIGRPHERDKDGKRIKFVADTDWMPLDAPASETRRAVWDSVPAKYNQWSEQGLKERIELGTWDGFFKGNEYIGTDDIPDKILELNTGTMPLHPSADIRSDRFAREQHVDPMDSLDDDA